MAVRRTDPGRAQHPGSAQTGPALVAPGRSPAPDRDHVAAAGASEPPLVLPAIDPPKGGAIEGVAEALKGTPVGPAARAKAAQALALTPVQLDDIRASLKAKILRGLAKDGEEIKALPAFLPPPSPMLQGRSLVLDTGGTNMRAAVIEIDGRGSKIVSGPLKQRVPDGRDGKEVTRADFFTAHRTLVEGLDGASVRGLPIGYCFSYPSEVLPSCDARLLQWTKGLTIPGVEGTLVGSALKESLADGLLEPGKVAVLNDTVACLLGGATAMRNEPVAGVIGLIAGTGSNMAAFFEQERISKLKTSWTGPMAINLESGNFSPPHLTAWDDALDAASNNPGRQRFEKAASGYYLPYLFQQIVPDVPGFDPAAGSSSLADLRERAPDTEAGKVAGLLLDRAADLVAAGLAAVIDVSDQPGDYAILAEGGLFWGIPGFKERVESTLKSLLEGGAKTARIVHLDDANLIGSACAALTMDAMGSRAS